MDYTSTNKKRLTCANCGYLWDVFGDESQICPKCGSNACDEFNKITWEA